MFALIHRTADHTECGSPDAAGRESSCVAMCQHCRVVVDSDRIAANGDVANKIGTYMVAVLAKRHGIPFYVAAPLSTIDLDTPDGSHIPIEERNDREVTHVGSSRLTPEGALIRNPAFDVTPAKYVTAIITERGVARPPYAESLASLVNAQPV